MFENEIRFRADQRVVGSAKKAMIDHLDKYNLNDSSSSDDSDDEDSKKVQKDAKSKENIVIPTASFRFVTRLDRNFPDSKMERDTSYGQHMMNFLNQTENVDKTKINDDSDSTDVVTDPDIVLTNIEIPKSKSDDDVKDIKKKIVEHEENQIKGIQLANAGRSDVKVVNSHAVTSHTCSIQ